MWLVPVSYSTLGAIAVAIVCNIILYLVALETNEKKAIKRQNEALQDEIAKLLDKEVDPKQKLLALCRERDLSDRDTQIAVMYYYEHKTPKQIWLWYCSQKDFEPVEWNTIYQILWRIGRKLK